MSSSQTVAAITCRDSNINGIGYNGRMPWHIPQDMKFFKELTSHVSRPGAKNLLVMGRKTYESLPKKFNTDTRDIMFLTKTWDYGFNSERFTMNKSYSRDCPLCFEKYTQNVKNNVDFPEYHGFCDSPDHTYTNKKYDLSCNVIKCSLFSSSVFDTYFEDYESVYVIGGNEIYQSFSNMGLLTHLYVGEVTFHNSDNAIEYDTYFINYDFADPWEADDGIMVPPAYIKTHDNLVTVETDEYSYRMTKYIDSNLHPETKYLALMKNILQYGNDRDQERTGTGSLSLFGQSLKIDLSDGYCPMMCTRRMYKNMINSEYQWYLSGSTNVDDLRRISGRDKTVWDDNTSREFLDANGFPDRAEGDIGPSYGWQFRHAGAKYSNESYLASSPDNPVGIDQIQQLLDDIRENPHSRRLIISLWSVPDIKNMSLPPCLRDYQFYIRKQSILINGSPKIVNVLDCKADQRSSDFFLAGYWNIYQVAYLIYYICEKNNDTNDTDNNFKLYPGQITMNYGDVHIYNHQIEVCRKQLEHVPDKYYTVTGWTEKTGFSMTPKYEPITNLSSRMAV